MLSQVKRAHKPWKAQRRPETFTAVIKSAMCVCVCVGGDNFSCEMHSGASSRDYCLRYTSLYVSHVVSNAEVETSQIFTASKKQTKQKKNIQLKFNINTPLNGNIAMVTKINASFSASVTKDTSSWCWPLKVYCYQVFFTHTYRMYMYTNICKHTCTSAPHAQRKTEYVGGLVATREVVTTTKNVCWGGEKGDGWSTTPFCTTSPLKTKHNAQQDSKAKILPSARSYKTFESRPAKFTQTHACNSLTKYK